MWGWQVISQWNSTETYCGLSKHCRSVLLRFRVNTAVTIKAVISLLMECTINTLLFLKAHMGFKTFFSSCSFFLIFQTGHFYSAFHDSISGTHMMLPWAVSLSSACIPALRTVSLVVPFGILTSSLVYYINLISQWVFITSCILW